MTGTRPVVDFMLADSLLLAAGERVPSVALWSAAESA